MHNRCKPIFVLLRLMMMMVAMMKKQFSIFWMRTEKKGNLIHTAWWTKRGKKRAWNIGLSCFKLLHPRAYPTMAATIILMHMCVCCNEFPTEREKECQPSHWGTQQQQKHTTQLKFEHAWEEDCCESSYTYGCRQCWTSWNETVIVGIGSTGKTTTTE